MTKTFCDRCGKEIKKIEEQVSVETTTFDEEGNAGNGLNVDVCRKCYKKIEEAIHG